MFRLSPICLCPSFSVSLLSPFTRYSPSISCPFTRHSPSVSCLPLPGILRQPPVFLYPVLSVNLYFFPDIRGAKPATQNTQHTCHHTLELHTTPQAELHRPVLHPEVMSLPWCSPETTHPGCRPPSHSLRPVQPSQTTNVIVSLK